MILLLLLALLSVSACDVVFESSDTGDLDLMEEAWEIIHEDFVDIDNLDDQELAEAALRGLIEALDDPYTSYLDPEQSALSSSRLEGGFSGIGATMTVKDGQLLVVAPIADSPAEKAGVCPGDQILEIDGESVSEMTLIEAALEIRGEKGTKVTLMILHVDEDDPVEIEIIRDTIDLPSVQLEMLSGAIAHISITNFSNRTGAELESALNEAVAQGVVGIVLDLRNNPGGVVSAAVDVVSEFVDEGIVVYSLDNENERREWEVKDGGIVPDIPLAVLVNAYSASASEVVAGALQDHGRGPVIGINTYGKGKMNLVKELSNGGVLQITFARWFTPDGRQIDGEGIVPDTVVEITQEDIENELDSQLEQAIEYLQNM